MNYLAALLRGNSFRELFLVKTMPFILILIATVILGMREKEW